MTMKPNCDDVDRLKRLLADAWANVLRRSPGERIYAAGFYTNEIGQFMFPFILGEIGLAEVAERYVDNGMYTADVAPQSLRWSTADSPYAVALSKNVYDFDGRPDIHELSPTSATREARYRLSAARDALRALDAEGLFGTGVARDTCTLYLEGGDVDRAWTLDWAEQVNPKSVFDRFASIGKATDTAGTFTEFGTKKVYETCAYAQSADRRMVAAATQYQLFLFETGTLKQRFARALPNKDDYCALGDVAMSADGAVIAVIPFGGGRHERSLFIVGGSKSGEVRTVELPARPVAVAISPAGQWIAVTAEDGTARRFRPDGSPLDSSAGHSAWPRAIAVSPDGESLVTADTSTTIVWNASDGTKRCTLPIAADSIDFDPTGRMFVCARRITTKGEAIQKTARIVDLRTGVVRREIAVAGYRIHVAKFSPDGRSLACAARVDTDGYAGTNTALLIDIASGAVREKLKADFEQIREFAFLPHRNEIAVAVFGHTRRPLVLWQQPARENA